MILGLPNRSKKQMLHLNGGVLGVVDKDLVRRVEALLLLFLLVSVILAPSWKKSKLFQAHALAPEVETRAPRAILQSFMHPQLSVR